MTPGLFFIDLYKNKTFFEIAKCMTRPPLNLINQKKQFSNLPQMNCFLKSRPMSTTKTSSRPPLSATQTVHFLKVYHPGIICTNLSQHGYHHIAVMSTSWGNCTIQKIDFPTDPPNFLSLPITNSKDTSFYL